MSTPSAPHPRLLQVGFSSRNAEAAAGFYTQALGFTVGNRFELKGGPYGQLIGLPAATLVLQRLHLGEECLEITQIDDAGPGQAPGQPIPADSRSCDLWFQHICLVTRDLQAALKQLEPALEGGLVQAVSSAPQTLPDWNRAAAGIRAYKFRDPEGHNLELLQFPPDKGEARWHRANDDSASGGATSIADPRPVVLGIDHSAISVASTEASCHFYETLLGLRLGGDGVNSGPTQDGLDGLSNTEVRITGHRCPVGAGIECLNYLPPNLGRPMPHDLSPQDLAHWQIRLAVDDLASIVERLEACEGRLLSPGIVDLGEQAHAIGARRAVQVADPDGHRLQLVEP
ncbi:MAG: lactoylglutathione lyase [Cyanobacteria bacterium M_surface_7_m2_040]|nr:lactoylglutathione lyase [Cyanobacteria bacterium M_surface_9_m1_291]MBM5827485.1 lactoylglutathione lyase [Cyanobacteria bacterium M_surface_7_m2_040]